MLSDLWLQWSILAFAALMVATAFATLVYMLGHFLNNEKMIVFGKAEIGEIIFSAVLIVVVLGILATATEAAGVLIVSVYPGTLGAEYCGPTFDAYFNDETGNDFPCHMRIARIYLDRLYAEGKIFNYQLLSIHMWYSFFQTIGFSADFHEHTSGSVQYTPMGAVFSIPSSIYSYMFEFGMKSMLIIRFQQFFLNFINYSIYPIFVVLGLILRTFPFSRRLGGLLMATGISLFFVFPMFYVMGGVIFQNISEEAQNLHGSPEVITALEFDPEQFYGTIGFSKEDEELLSGEYDPEKLTSEYLSTQLWPNDVNFCQPNDSGAEEGFGLLIDWIKQFFYAVDFTGLLITNEDYIDSLISPGGVIDATARFVFFSMFFALLAVFATVGAIRSLSPLLGGDVELAGLTHLI